MSLRRALIAFLLLVASGAAVAGSIVPLGTPLGFVLGVSLGTALGTALGAVVPLGAVLSSADVTMLAVTVASLVFGIALVRRKRAR